MRSTCLVAHDPSATVRSDSRPPQPEDEEHEIGETEDEAEPEESPNVFLVKTWGDG